MPASAPPWPRGHRELYPASSTAEAQLFRGCGFGFCGLAPVSQIQNRVFSGSKEAAEQPGRGSAGPSTPPHPHTLPTALFIKREG